MIRQSLDIKKKGEVSYGRQYFTDVYDSSKEGRRIAYKRGELLLKKNKGIKKILDVGCGMGDFLDFFEGREIETVGVDISSYALSKVRKRVNCDLYQLDVASQRLPFPNKSFDAVTVFDVVEHLKSAELLFSELYRVLKPKGLVFLTTPNNQGRIGDLLKRVFPEDPTHINVRGVDYWVEGLAKEGFKNLEYKGCILHGFPPTYMLRQKLEKLGFPVSLRPFFFPAVSVCGTLYIWGRKP